MSEDIDRLICPECDEPLEVEQEWLITDRTLLGTTAGSTEEMQGDYAHKECLDR